MPNRALTESSGCEILTHCGISGYFRSQLFSSILSLHKTTQTNDLQKGRIDRKFLFSSVPLRLQLITDAADNTVIYLCEPCQPCEAYNYSN